MAARNNQITVANNLIDRTSAAISADRTDKLNYYNTLLNFYDKQRTEEGTKLLTLTTKQKGWITAQIGLLGSDLKTVKDNAENLKKAMMDPDTALLYAQAGITITTPQSEIPGKTAQVVYAKSIQDASNKMAEDGYTFLAPGQNVPEGTSVVTKTFTAPDGSVLTKNWYKKATAPTASIKAIAYYQIKQRATQIFSDGMTADEYRQFQNELINYGLGEYLDNFDKWISDMGYLTPAIKKEVGIAEKVEPTVQSVLDTEKKIFQQYKDANYSRKNVEDQYKAENKLTEIPEPIKRTLDEVYGVEKKWYEKIREKVWK